MNVIISVIFTAMHYIQIFAHYIQIFALTLAYCCQFQDLKYKLSLYCHFLMLQVLHTILH